MIAFSLPSVIPVYVSSLFLALGAGVGLLWIAWQAPEKDTPHLIEAGLWVLMGGLIGARLVYVLINWEAFAAHPLSVLQVYRGGLSWSGALAGGLAALLLAAAVVHMPLAKLADNLLPLLVGVTVGAWLGCWVDGCAYGPLVPPGWGLMARDEFGEFSLRWPLQLSGALLTVSVFWLVEWFARRAGWPAGLAAGASLAGLAILLLGSSFLRADPALLWRGLRLDSWAALGFTVLGIFVVFWIWSKENLSNKRGSDETNTGAGAD